MSKNFELMQDAQIRLDIPEIGQLKPSPAPVIGKANGNGKRARFNSEDEVTREESSKLVQSLFLSHREESHKR